GAVTAVYQASRVPNVAFVGIGAAAVVVHGDLITPGGRFEHIVGWWPAFAIALAVAAVLGVATEVLVRPLQHRPLPALLLMSAWTAALLAATNALWEPKLLPPVWGGPALAIGDFSIPRSQVAILALSAACGLAVSALSRRTRFGLALRASAADPEAAQLMGMDPQVLSRGAWVLSSVPAAVA